MMSLMYLVGINKNDLLHIEWEKNIKKQNFVPENDQRRQVPHEIVTGVIVTSV